MAIRIKVYDTGDGPGSVRQHDIELEGVPREGELLAFDSGGDDERVVTVRTVFWLINDPDCDVQIRAW